eukprot:COSAG02_NODE_11284_length_1754_cov_2.073716_1_plen_40_part_10
MVASVLDVLPLFTHQSEGLLTGGSNTCPGIPVGPGACGRA